MASEQRPYRVLLAISETAQAEAWIRLAKRLLPAGGEIALRGMIIIPEGESLSEGAIRAQRLRDKFNDLAAQYPTIRHEQWVRVDYRPLWRILNELADSPVDLLLVDWQGPGSNTGGVTTNAILKYSPCDIGLICGESWQNEAPVLLSLRGGPNLSLGVRLAQAMADTATISLIHVTDGGESPLELQTLVKGSANLDRVVTVRNDSDVAAGILREVQGHKAIVMGATFVEPDAEVAVSGELIGHVFEQANLPLALIRAAQPEELVFHPPRFSPQVEESVSVRVDRWFAENTFDGDEFSDLNTLMVWKEKQGVTISACLPAYNEEDNVGNVVQAVKTALMDQVPLLDELILIDGGSTDKTVQIVEEIGIPVYRSPDILPEVGFVPGKGEALWKSLHVSKGDIVAWIDTDITNIHPRFIYGILGPLLKHTHIQYVKGFYTRPIRVDGKLQAYGGGRVTELVARPWFNLFYPELSGIVQPLSGEYAGRRSALERVPFFSGYGVETGLLLDLLELFGLNAIAQTNLKERVHHNQPLVGLSKMAFAILQVFIARLENRYGVRLLDLANPSMKLITQTPERLALDVQEIGDTERPPMITVAGYQARYQD